MPPLASSALRFWLLFGAALLALLWLFSPALPPFILGLIIAYFLEPAVGFLEKRKIKRWVGTLLVLFGFFFMALSVLLLLWPMINAQIAALIDVFPRAVQTVRERYLPWAQHWLAQFSAKDVESFRTAASQSTGDAVGLVGATVKRIVSGGVALLDILAISVLTPVTAFYVLVDWKKLTKNIDQLIPRRSYSSIKAILNEMDKALSGFLRGQALVCLVLGSFFSIGLALCGLEYGATLGLVAGILTIIPYVGTLFGWGASFLLACAQFSGNWPHIGAVVGVFVLGHILEGYVLTPRFVGNRVGLPSLWVLFALMAGAEVMGFMGVLIAVPVASIVGVLVRFGVRQYKESALYK